MPAFLLPGSGRFTLSVEGADWFRGALESRVVSVHDNLAYHSSDIVWLPCLSQAVSQRVLNHITHEAFRGGSTDVQRHGWHRRLRHRAGQEEVAYLWPIPVSDYDAALTAEQAQQLFGRAPQILILLLAYSP